MRYLRPAVVAIAAALASCGGEPPADPLCSREPLPPGASVKPGQAGLQVSGTTNEHFNVADESGKSVGYDSLNRTLGVAPGKYRVSINKSVHTVVVPKSSLTKCPTGTLVVRGSTNEHYSVRDPSGASLNYNTLGRPLAFFPGEYVVEVNKTTRKFALAAGELKELLTGTIVTKGQTNEHYSVTDASGNNLNYNTLNRPLAFFPGTVRVEINKTQKEAKVVEAQVSELETGALVVAGKGNEHYTVSDRTGNSLNYNSLNRPLSFFPAEYNVKLREQTRAVTVTPGQTASIEF